MEVGFKDDKIFLLSSEEYEMYKEIIPHFRCWWWLRSPGFYGNCADLVDYEGSFYHYGCYVDDFDAVRPALRESTKGYRIGDRNVFCDFPFIMIDKNLWIAEVPIGFNRFDKESNDYESSEIRQFILDWINRRS